MTRSDWSYESKVYAFTGGDKPLPVSLTVCGQLETGWTQSYSASEVGCHLINLHPTGFDRFFYVDSYNGRPVDVSACKDRPNGTPVRGWMVSLTREGETLDTKPTGADGCYKWSGLEPGVSYDVHETERAG